MKLQAAIAALLVVTASNAQSVPLPFTSCAPTAVTSTVMNVTSVIMTPNPPCAGQQVCMAVTGTLSEPITSGGALTIYGKYNGRVVYTNNLDLCTVLAASGTPCPIPVTTTTLTGCIPVSADALTGYPANWTVTAYNGDGELISQQCAAFVASKCST